ncbi:nuclear transport factor 2 family protein [Halomonas sp. McH1-25]|uniref:nuclear transport factor 2 family protein n=1 Tax=unclassified Halomonas TaxID=2609666 RepID=UPI001EF459C1|nr:MULTISPECIES: nuclear transport factor 2 family protein [unclassified Halomonas]MCG7602179.1 nuclear transport factor 2 family protein [Halomonas sp. McH1-25]MCP1344681.1 nuclear transport factor 2 family protein [Halomonas sp. FL8]MCP1362486.1 nuclear transport factor 2 family protein [Halomonas sp. BBD45]MCP1365207.1 nuclear transport factor 2 family protein [Halomonas sp. BBD48]
MKEISIADLNSLIKRIEVLEAEAEIRRIQAHYMFLCDTPLPKPGLKSDAERIDCIMDLYTEDAIWEGVGSYYDNQFGRLEGAVAIRHHFEKFWGEKQDPELLFNVHYLTSEQIHVNGDIAEGQWIHCQPWIFSDGKSLLRSSRLNNAFRKEPDGRWKITRTRTENVFVAPLKKGWAESFPDKSVLME